MFEVLKPGSSHKWQHTRPYNEPWVKLEYHLNELWIWFQVVDILEDPKSWVNALWRGDASPWFCLEMKKKNPHQEPH